MGTNRLRILKPADIAAAQKERIIIYGRAGIGKTRLALSLPASYGKIAYYAADQNSEFLTSIDAVKRERIIVVKPEGDDPTALFMQFAMQDWKKIDPAIGTLVVDTYTKVALDAIRHSANTGAVTAEKHFVVGDPANGGQVLPNRGDYMAIDSLSRGFLDMIFTRQKDMNILFLCHEDVKIIENVHAVGGPAHPGRAMTEYLPAQFNTVIRLIREQTLVPGADAPEDVVIAITENDGKFIAKVRTADETGANPLARVLLERNPSSYWTKYYDPQFAVVEPNKENSHV
jgi:energy-coupling factor transporter ATP-binding protein EcfA2